MLVTRLFETAYLAYQSRDQARYPFKPWATVERDQSRRVRAMAAYACRCVPYYRETMQRLGLRPADFQSVSDLHKLPIVERADIQRDPEYFVSVKQPLDSYFRMRSSGSSGAPITVCYDTAALLSSAAHSRRERSITIALIGRSQGYREAVIATLQGSTQRARDFCERHTFFPRGVRVERQYLDPLDPLDKNVSLLNSFRPDIIHSYGSYLEILFPYLCTAHRPFHCPKVITYSSDELSTSVRWLITETFGIPVFGDYQAIEAFKIGFECEQHSGLHLNMDLYPVRIVDTEGRPVPPGESGDVVVSNLVNRGTVLLNYRLGDVACLLSTPCPCGRSLPLLSLLEGRCDDRIYLPSGQAIHPNAARGILAAETEVWQYQVVQENETHFHILIVAAENCDRPGAMERVTARFARAFGPEVVVAFSFVDSIERTAGGKLRPVLSMRPRPSERLSQPATGQIVPGPSGEC